MKMFINLAVGDLSRSRSFFTALGFQFDDNFKDPAAIIMKIGPGCNAILVANERFTSLTPKAIADASQTSEVLLGLQLDSREAVDEMMDKALAQGASVAREAADHGYMYDRAFSDLDGHIWEPFWMQAPKAGSD